MNDFEYVEELLRQLRPRFNPELKERILDRIAKQMRRNNLNEFESELTYKPQAFRLHSELSEKRRLEE